MKQLKSYILTGTVFVLILGSLSHFFYEWSGSNFIVGLLSPVNESTWEHIKLLYFPMLLYSLIAIPTQKSDYPCITSAFAAGILIGVLLIPVLFYTYTGILGYNVLVLDIGTFVLSVVLSFYFIYRFTLTCRFQNFACLLWIVICLLGISFMMFSYCPPDIGLFADPNVNNP